MLLEHKLSCPQVNLALEVFLREIHGLLASRLVSVVLYGSVVFDDLAPAYGDLDFVAVVQDDLADQTCVRLADIRRPLRSGDYGAICQMIEGAFRPRKMLNPDVTGQAFWWGTSSERKWQRNELGWFVLHVIRECGIVVWGADPRREVPEVSREVMAEELAAGWRDAQRHMKPGELHCVGWLLEIARSLLWLREGRLSSKSEAADWGYRNAQGDWRRMLPRAKRVRLNPTLANCADVKAWLDGLAGPIGEAYEELQCEFRRQRIQ